jgi:hypothetical protein
MAVLREHQAGIPAGELCRRHGVSEATPDHSCSRYAFHLIATWRDDYNHHRPHTSLDGLAPR